MVFFNNIAIGVPTGYFLYRGIMWRGTPPLRELPSLHWLLLSLAACVFIEEIGFYYSHR